MAEKMRTMASSWVGRCMDKVKVSLFSCMLMKNKRICIASNGELLGEGGDDHEGGGSEVNIGQKDGKEGIVSNGDQTNGEWIKEANGSIECHEAAGEGEGELGLSHAGEVVQQLQESECAAGKEVPEKAIEADREAADARLISQAGEGKASGSNDENHNHRHHHHRHHHGRSSKRRSSRGGHRSKEAKGSTSSSSQARLTRSRSNHDNIDSATFLLDAPGMRRVRTIDNDLSSMAADDDDSNQQEDDDRRPIESLTDDELNRRFTEFINRRLARMKRESLDENQFP